MTTELRPVHSALRVLGLVALTGGFTGCGPTPDQAPGATVASSGACDAPSPIAELPPALYEASGITRDPRRPDLFWAHNDSGNDAELFAVDVNGRIRAIVAIAGATERDLEDIALGPCPSGECLYLADIGDNFAVHRQVYIHRLPLPDLPDALPEEPLSLAPIRPTASWALTYPGGARDAESLAIDGRRGELLIATKGREGYAELYSIGLDALAAAPGPHSLVRAGRLPVPMGAHTSQYLTAADLSPDGARLAVRSYTTLYEFAWKGSVEFDSLPPPVASTLVPALEPQGEGLAWAGDGEMVMLISEGRSSRLPSLSSMRCPADRRLSADRPPPAERQPPVAGGESSSPPP